MTKFEHAIRKAAAEQYPQTPLSSLKNGCESMLLAQMSRDLFRPSEAQFRFAPGRKFAFDFAWPDLKIAIEIEGGHWTRGRHNRPMGFAKDMEKYNLAAAMGWRVFRFTSDMVRKSEAIAFLTGLDPKRKNLRKADSPAQSPTAG